MAQRPYVVGVIPARYASQRLPAKPLIDLLGKTMVQRVYEQAQQALLLNRVVVATDDKRIADVVQSFGGEIVLTDPKIKSGSDRVAAVAEQVQGDMFVNVQGDEPLIVPEMIDTAVQVVLDDEKADVGTLVKKIEIEQELINPSIVKVVVGSDRYALYFSRSVIPWIRDSMNPFDWLKHHTFYKHIGLYVFRRDFLLKYSAMPESALEKAERLEQLRILENGLRIKVGITEHDSIPIDTEEDVDRVLGILKRK